MIDGISEDDPSQWNGDSPPPPVLRKRRRLVKDRTDREPMSGKGDSMVPRVSKRTGEVLYPGDAEYDKAELQPTVATTTKKRAPKKLTLKKQRWTPGVDHPLPTNSREWSWTPLHHALLESREFSKLRFKELQVFIHLMARFRGHNNGKLTATLRELQRRFHWGDSPDTLKRALDGLIAKKFIRRTRDPFGAAPAWYELSWLTNRLKKEH